MIGQRARLGWGTRRHPPRRFPCCSSTIKVQRTTSLYPQEEPTRRAIHARHCRTAFSPGGGELWGETRKSYLQVWRTYSALGLPSWRDKWVGFHGAAVFVRHLSSLSNAARL